MFRLIVASKRRLFLNCLQFCDQSLYREYYNSTNSSFGSVQNIILSYKKIDLKMAKQNFQYLLILDFEATCFKKFDNPDFGAQSQEIIEFPALKLNPETLTVESTFQEFVKPVIHPELSDFCTKLTSITQHDVDNSGVFAEVLKRFNAWYEKEVGASSCLPITCGDWDLKTMLPNQCRREGIPVPPALRQWHNLKKSYCAATSVYCRSLTEMLHGLSLSFEGRLHRGIDDCRNINTIVVELLKRGIVFNPTGRL